MSIWYSVFSFFLSAARFCADERCLCDDTFDDATVSPYLSLSALLFFESTPLDCSSSCAKGCASIVSPTALEEKVHPACLPS